MLVKVGESTVSPKYQIVIRSVANWLDVEPGDKVELHVEDGVVKLKKKGTEMDCVFCNKAIKKNQWRQRVGLEEYAHTSCLKKVK